MSRRSTRRLATATAVALTLALAAPAHAWPDPARLAQQALHWIAGLWPADTLTPDAREKTGDLHPDASPDPANSSTSCLAEGCDRGGGIDPDG